METLDDLLRAKGLRATCPCCQKSFALRNARLFDATRPLPEHARRYLARERDVIVEGRRYLSEQRRQLQRRSLVSTTSGGIGQTLEMVAASLPGLPSSPRDCRALLKPLDYVAFDGASTGTVEAIRFIEVKTGRQGLSKLQRAIKTAVEAGNVSLRVANHQLAVEK